MIKVVIDTNVIISALNFGSKPEKILQLANEGKFKLFISPFILEEVMNVLIKKFNWTEVKVKRGKLGTVPNFQFIPSSILLSST